MNNKFTKNAVKAFNIANKTSMNLNSEELMLEHLFIGILGVKEGIASKILSQVGLDPDETIRSIQEELAHDVTSIKDIINEPLQSKEEIEYKVDVKLSDEIKTVLEKAFESAINSGHNYIGTEHILLGLLMIKDHPFIAELAKLGINYQKIKKELDNFVQYPDFNMGQGNIDPEKVASPVPRQLNGSGENSKQSSTNTILETLGRNLTGEARDGKLDPVIGRDKEIERVMQILSRRNKNNPILIGDAGVGKTAIVEGLAQRIAFGEVSPVLANYEIWSIDTATIVAGSQLRGDIESKILELINEIENRKNIILFVDEIHTIMGAGSTGQNSLDIANILKPALARGVLHCIGATTIDEYRKTFDNDPALQRRFQPVDVDELTSRDTLKVLKQIRPIYEAFHNVKITDVALRAAVKLSGRYITDRYLPDKAIDVIDEACSKNKLNRIQVSSEFKEELEKLSKIVNKKNDALKQKQLDIASKYLDMEREVMAHLKDVEQGMREKWDKKGKVINEDDIIDVVHSWTNIPIYSMKEDNLKVIKKLEDDLDKSVIGQDYACSQVVNSIKRTKAGLSGLERPLASFLFVGPTGVGKTELAKQLAKSLFGSKEALIQVDMSEMMESHSVSKLIGAPPGYIGYDMGGQLTTKVRRKPFSVVLFDEIEKANPDVLNILLQILDEGHLTDAKGRKVDFRNTIIIMTSNIGSEFLNKESSLGIFLGDDQKRKNEEAAHKIFEIEEKILDSLKEYLQPEFINRIDDIIMFRELDKKDVYKIAKLQVNNFLSNVKEESNIEFKLKNEKDLLNHIVKLGFSEEYGAREINRAVKASLENQVAEKILSLKRKSKSKRIRFDIAVEKNQVLVSVSA